MIPSKEEWTAALALRHGVENQKKFSNACVAICGLGGLGSNIAVALARVGIKKLILIDFDCVDMVNLHRQQYKLAQIGQYKTDALASNLQEINPYIELESHNIRLSESNASSLLNDAVIVCEAFDDPESKATLSNFVLEALPEKYLVSSSGMAGFGNPNDIQTRQITERFYLCGDCVSDVSNGIGLVASRVMLCAAHQAHTVLQILLNH